MRRIVLLFAALIGSLTTVLYAQNSENAFRPEEIKTQKNNRGNNYFLGDQSAIALTGNGTFIYSSFAQKNAAGDFYRYDNNESYVSTLTAADPADKVAIRFQYFETETNADFLYIYDGPNEQSPLLAKLSGTVPHNRSFVSTGNKLTLKFTSNGNTTATGFKLLASNFIKDSDKNRSFLRSLTCSGVAADNECINAPLICDFNDYCGTTSAAYTAGNTTPFGSFCGSLENNSWISFIAGAPNMSFKFTSAGCLDNASGIQALIYATPDCVSFTEMSTCESQSNSAGTFTLSTIYPLTIGEKYYIMIDGFAGNVCSYTITSIQGSVGGTIMNSTYQEICPGYTTTLTSAAASSNYAWTDNFGNTYANQQSITVSPTVTTTYSLAIDSNACGLATTVKTITVNNTLTTPSISSPSIICSGQTTTLSTTISGYNYLWNGPNSFTSAVQNPVISNFNASNNGTYSLQISIDAGCTSTTAVKTITASPSPTVGLAASTTSLCNFTSGSTVTFTASGTNVVNGYAWNWNSLETGMATQMCVSIPFVGLQCNNSGIPIQGLAAGPSTTATPTMPTTVCVVATNTFGCVSTSTCISITEASTATLQTTGNTYLCRGDSTLILATGTAPFTWTVPSNGGLISLSADGDSLWVKPQVQASYNVKVVDINSCPKIRNITVAIDTLCVWPGDTDRDGIANQNDLLPIGIYYGDNGAARPDQTTNWEGHYCLPWSAAQVGGVNLKHIDSDGNGTVQSADTLAIYQNVGLTHVLRTQQTNTLNSDVLVTFHKPSYNAGDTVIATIALGRDTAQLYNFYGAAFKFGFDGLMVQPGTQKFNFLNSWVGTPLQNVLTFNYLNTPTSEFLEAFVRNNHANTSGYGRVAEARFVLLSTTTSTVFTVSFTDGVKTSNDYNLSPLGVFTATVPVNPGVTGISKHESASLSIYPNPTKGLVSITSSNEMQKMELTNVAGQRLVNETINDKTYQLHLEGFAEGIYFLKVTYANGMSATKKVIVNR